MTSTTQWIQLSMLPAVLFLVLVAWTPLAHGQSTSFDTFVNPVIPGDHPDPTLTRVGGDFYTSGSSFNPTPKIYRSTDLVHWEVISQPVSAAWSQYGDAPGGGIWGGHMVLYNAAFWHFFGKGSSMWFVKAEQPEGPWSEPVSLRVPAGVPGLGRDNSIFIDDDGRWYLLVKNGQENNFIVELDETGQPNGEVLDLRWINPASEGLPYGWAEGPVMWKRDGTYYYSFAQHLAGNQYVMWSDTLTDDETAWTVPQNLFESVSDRNSRIFRDPNHNAPAVTAPDGTSWTISQAYYGGIGGEWMAQGRQGILSEIRYDESGAPVALFPSNGPMDAPDLPSSGIPWAVPKSDMFNTATISPEWSFLGFTPTSSWSLTEREGWLRLRPYAGQNTVVKNDAEHSYSLITRVDFTPESQTDEAGLWVFNGLETLRAKLYSTVSEQGEPAVTFSFESTAYSVENTAGAVVWLKIERLNHVLTGFYSEDGTEWIQVGQPINVLSMDRSQPDFNAFTGNQQGPYVRGKGADFDLYIYRDAYSAIPAQHPANYNGITWGGNELRSILAGDWVMYAGVEFGAESESQMGLDYQRMPESLEVVAASAASGGVIEVWLDSLDTGQNIAGLNVAPTAGWTDYATFTVPIDSISGRHDVYVRFAGEEGAELLRLRTLRFVARRRVNTSVGEGVGEGLPATYTLHQNHPNPFNPATTITYEIPETGRVSLSIYDVVGRRVATLVDAVMPTGSHTLRFDGSGLATGLYFYRLRAGGHSETRRMILAK